MDNEAVLKDISLRTDGDIYLGVVGAVRTGKSTFIRGSLSIFSFIDQDGCLKQKQ